MKSLIILFLFITFGATAQSDTILITKPVNKQVNIQIVNIDTSGIKTEVSETLTYEKAIKRIVKLKQDSFNLEQQSNQITQFENQIKTEKIRIRKQQNQTINLIDRLKKLLPSLLP
jgi:uncharacterized protein YllA (UPF0747 family)